MLDFKQEIAEYIAKVITLSQEEIKAYIEKPKDTKNGDYAFPCFRLSKELKKPPIEIANDIKEKIKINPDIIEKVEVVGRIPKFLCKQQKISTRSNK